MNTDDRELSQAAAALTVDDFNYLRAHGIIPEPEPSNTQYPANTQCSGNTQVNTPQEPASKPTPRKKRRQIEHPWPDVGGILEADYHGVHYEAEVIPMPRLKSGKAMRILTGPAAGITCRSMTGAMLKATEDQRNEMKVGRNGVPNGWDFWKVSTGG